MNNLKIKNEKNLQEITNFKEFLEYNDIVSNSNIKNQTIYNYTLDELQFLNCIFTNSNIQNCNFEKIYIKNCIFKN